MTEAETILKMIETVDLADTAKLDEIDAQVGFMLFDQHFHNIGDHRDRTSPTSIF